MSVLALICAPRMKLQDITEWSERWSKKCLGIVVPQRKTPYRRSMDGACVVVIGLRRYWSEEKHWRK